MEHEYMMIYDDIWIIRHEIIRIYVYIIYIYIDNDNELRIYDDLGDTIFLDEQIALRQSDASRQSEGRRHVDV